MEHLLINGTPSRTNTPLHQGDILTVHIVEEHSSYHVPPVKLPLSIVYEDEDILVANKPAKIHWQMLLPGTTVTAAILSFAAQTA